MEMNGLSNAIIEFLLLTSALVFSLGLLSFLALKILKIRGNPKLWIYALLLIIPLAYPLQTFFPAPIDVPLPLKTRHFIDLHLIETNAAKSTVSDGSAFPTANTAATYQAGDRETTFSVEEAINNSSTIHPMGTAPGLSVNWKLAAVSAWLSVFLYFLVRLAVMVYKTNRFSKFLDPVTDRNILKLLRKCTLETGVRRRPRLLTLDRLPTPMVMGFFRPRILLPKHLLKPEFREGLRFTLLHELKHVQQRHNWWLLIESIIGAAYFFHPVILWAKKRIHEELEYICDNHVVHVTNESISYADFLLHEIWQRKCEKNLVLALPFISGRKKTTSRIHSILENTGPAPFARIRGVFALCLILASFVSLLLCNVAPSAQDPEQASRQITPATTGTVDNASFHTQTDSTENEVLDAMRHEGIYNKGEESFTPSAEQPFFDNSAVSGLTAESGARADMHRNDTLGKLEEAPGIVLAQNDSPVASAVDSDTVPETRGTSSKTETVVFQIQQGIAHHKHGRFDEAIAAYTTAIKINAESAVVYNNRGSAYCEKGKYGEAVSDYNKAIEIMPGYATAYANRGYAFFMQGRYGKAVSDLDRAIALAPVKADAYYTRGCTYYRIGRIDKAVYDFNMAIALNPDYIAKMPEGIIPVRKKGDTDYTPDVAESLKWHHGSLPLHYWDTTRMRDVDSRANLYRIKKKGL